MMIEKSKSSLARSLQAAKSQLSNVREKAEAATEKGIGAGLAIGAAYGTGYVYKNHPNMTKIAGTEIDTALALGVVAVLVGVTDMAGKQSSHVLNVGVGSLSAYAALKGAGVA